MTRVAFLAHAVLCLLVAQDRISVYILRRLVRVGIGDVHHTLWVLARGGDVACSVVLPHLLWAGTRAAPVHRASGDQCCKNDSKVTHSHLILASDATKPKESTRADHDA